MLATLLTFLAARGSEVRDSVLTVTGPIAENEFRERDDFHTVRISGVTAIPDYAFTYCGRLRRVELPAGVTRIGRGAFAWCERLERVDLPSSLRDLGSHAFAFCFSLTEISIPPGVTHIGSNCFSFCTSLRQVSLPPAITELESYAFSECASLQSAVLPAHDRLLGEMIFAGCGELRSVTESSCVPPKFDCDSQPFDPDEAERFDNVELLVPARSVDAYRKAPGWRLFKNINPIKI